jgi:hypothetical protein
MLAVAVRGWIISWLSLLGLVLMEKWLNVDKLLDLTKLAQQTVQTLAILVGGVWAYFKFIRGRTFASRAEVSVKGALYSVEDQPIIKATVYLRNTGASKLAAEKEGKIVRLYGAKLTNASGSVEWVKLRTNSIFGSHGWIESQETITEELLLPASSNGDASWSAYKLEAVVLGKLGRIRRKGVKWSGDTIIPGEMKSEAQSNVVPDPHRPSEEKENASGDGLASTTEFLSRRPRIPQESRIPRTGAPDDSEADNDIGGGGARQD